MIEKTGKHPVRIYHLSYDRIKGGDIMLRNITKLAECLIEETDEFLDNKRKITRKFIKGVRKCFEELKD
jgi:hypothetical protein